MGMWADEDGVGVGDRVVGVETWGRKWGTEMGVSETVRGCGVGMGDKGVDGWRWGCRSNWGRASGAVERTRRGRVVWVLGRVLRLESVSSFWSQRGLCPTGKAHIFEHMTTSCSLLYHRLPE